MKFIPLSEKDDLNKEKNGNTRKATIIVEKFGSSMVPSLK